MPFLRFSAATVFVVTSALACGCSASTSRSDHPTGPTPLPATPATAITIDGRLSELFSGTSLVNAAITPANGRAVMSDGDGAFRLSLDSPIDAIDLRVLLAGFIDRQATVRAGGLAQVSMIGSGFDLRAFDEMYRSPQLTRWTVPPPLVIETTALRFAGFDGSAFTATATALSDNEITPLVDDMRWAMPQLTGGQFTDFASIARQQSAPGSSVTVLNAGVITVALYEGLKAATGYWGYGRTLLRPDGEVVGGSIMIDRDFNRSGSSMRRALRAHELAHALGANHVTSRTSVMNAAVTTEPTAWDRDAARLAFQRPPGNRYPDADPSGRSVARVTGPATWQAGDR